MRSGLLVNLLSDKRQRRPFSRLDPEQFRRFQMRLERLFLASRKPSLLGRLERECATFEASLEELESVTSLLTAADLLDAFDRVRADATSDFDGRDVGPIAGAFFCYWPGRSLSTGEAELASRGYFDVMDRPPLANWLESIARPMASNQQEFEVAILVWVPEADLDRAHLGRRACGTGSLALLPEASTRLAEQLQPLLRDEAVAE
jgi:hypothetical protein